MEIHELSSQLHAHEQKSEHRFDKLHHEINKQKEHQMSEPVSVKNIFEPNPMGAMMPFLGGGYGGAGAGAGAGLGAGLLGGVLGGALLGGRGLLGNEGRVNGGEGCVTPTQLTAALAGVEDNQMNTAVLSQLGRIEAAIPYNESQVQLALAGVQSDITGLINSANIANLQGQFAINKNVSDTTAQIIAAEVATQVAVGNAVTGALQNTFALSQAINNDGEKTRALIQSIDSANLNRQLTVSDLDRRDESTRARQREIEINITNTATANAQQMQAQGQSQQQLQFMAQLVAEVRNLAGDIQAVRQGQTIFNSGTMAASGTQTAANTKVN